MARRLIVHAGMPRAGSSTVQEVLFGHRRELAAAGLLYPVLGAELAATSDLTQIYNHKLLFQAARGLWPSRRFSPLHDDIARQISATAAPLALLSYEGWWDPRHHRALKRSLAALRRHEPQLDIAIVVVVREPVAFLLSLYKLDVLHGRTAARFEAYWIAKLDDPRLRYSSIAGSLGGMAPSCRFLSFEDATADDRLLVHFLDAAGAPGILERAGLARLAAHRSAGTAIFSDAVVSMMRFAARQRGLKTIARQRAQLLPLLLGLSRDAAFADAVAALAIPVGASAATAIAAATKAEAQPFFRQQFGRDPAAFQLSTAAMAQSEIAEDSALGRAIMGLAPLQG